METKINLLELDDSLVGGIEMIDRRKFLKFTLILSGILAGGSALIVEFLSSDDEVSRPAQKILDVTYKIKEGHPRIYLSPGRLESIRKRCADKRGAQAAYYGYLKHFAEKFNPGGKKPSVYDCLVLAFIYAVGEVPGYDYSNRSIKECGKLGIDVLTKLTPPVSFGGFSENTPILIACYDWLFPALVPKQRAIVFGNFTSVADAMRKKVPVPGQYRGTAEMYAYYGLAFYGDGRHMYPDDPVAAAGVDRKAKEYCDFFVSWHRNGQVDVLETTCKGGAYPAGTMYGETPFPKFLWPLDAWDTASTSGLYEDTSIFTGYPLFLLYQMLPYHTHVRYSNANGKIDQPGGIVRFGDYRYIGYTAAANRHVDINMAQAQGVVNRLGYHDLSSVFNWLIQFRDNFKIEPFGGPFPANKRGQIVPFAVWDIVFRDGLVEAKSPGQVELPLAYHFGSTDSGSPIKPDFPHGRPEGGGVVVMRSSWDDPDSTLVWFKASSHAVIHSHRDQGSFQIYKKGWLAIDSGQYEETTHLGNYTSRTIAHNSILAYRPGESPRKDKVNPVWHGYANDGGQRWAKVSRTLDEIKDTKNFLGGVTKFESVRGTYDYAYADITRSYNSNYVTDEYHPAKIALITRSLFFLRPDEYIVIFDKVNSTKAEYPKRWLLHSIYRPELDGTESFEGVIPYSHNILGKPEGVRLRGNKRGGISESKDTNIITIKGWNFGPSDSRLLCRTLLPGRHITRVVGGSDLKGVRKTSLAQPYSAGISNKENPIIFVQSANGFEIGDFVYLAPSESPYSHGNYGQPYWPVDDVFYQGWGKIKSVDKKTNRITMVPYRYNIPELPEGTLVVRSDHANAGSFEFMDAEYTQWPMHGEAVANAGPFYDQHGSWRIEIEPIEKKTNDVFLHVMLPCESRTLSESQRALKEKVKLIHGTKSVEIEIDGGKRTYKVIFNIESPDARIIVTESGKTILDNKLTRDAIKSRAR